MTPPPISPDEVMRQIAEALPAACRPNVIIIGSLAAGYYFFAGDGQRSIRTKDVDCMFSPYASAVAAAEDVTEQLLAAAWEQRTEGDWGKPGDANTPEAQLPLVRLKPPGDRGGADWFLELLGAPDGATEQSKSFHRVKTTAGHFALCSFNYLALTEWQHEVPVGVVTVIACVDEEADRLGGLPADESDELGRQIPVQHGLDHQNALLADDEARRRGHVILGPDVVGHHGKPPGAICLEIRLTDAASQGGEAPLSSCCVMAWFLQNEN